MALVQRKNVILSKSIFGILLVGKVRVGVTVFPDKILQAKGVNGLTLPLGWVLLHDGMTAERALIRYDGPSNAVE